MMKHQSIAEKAEEILADNDVEYLRMADDAAVEVLKSWLKVYAAQEVSNLSFWTSKKGNCLWHLFRSIKNYSTGPEATKLYLEQHPTDYFVFGTAPLFAFKCTGKYVDFFHDDVYVSHHNMKWTMFYTHEIHNKLGPYFAEAKNNTIG